MKIVKMEVPKGTVACRGRVNPTWPLYPDDKAEYTVDLFCPLMWVRYMFDLIDFGYNEGSRYSHCEHHGGDCSQCRFHGFSNIACNTSFPEELEFHLVD